MILTSKKLYLTMAVSAVFSLGNVTCSNAASVSITNPGFESSWSGWTDTDPSAITSDGHTGSKGAKITGSAGKFEQNVTVEPNTDYILSAYIKGVGKIGATVNGTRYTRTGGGSGYEQVSVSFNSGSASTVTIFGNYYGGEGRFDDFTLESTTSVTTTPETTACSATDDLVIASAFDDGTNDGHGPENTIDGDLTDTSRWSSKGLGKSITYDLGSEATVKTLKIQWFKGDSRSSYFDVDTSTNNSDWTSVLASGVSSGSSSTAESANVLDSNARYVRITGLGNSANTWNSIIETTIRGCGQTVTTTPTPTTPTGTLNWDWSVWDIEGTDPTVGNTFVFKPLETQVTTPNGHGWRHELKIKESERVAMTAVYENFQANIKADLSTGSKTIVAQHHASTTGTIMKLYISDSSESGFIDSKANNGIFDVYVRLAKADGSGEEKKALGTIRSGDNFDFQVINDHGYVTVSAMGASFSLTVADNSASYLKFGNYLQAQDAETGIDASSSADFAQFYADRGITTSVVTYSNMSYTRIKD
jgi:hypothetical protein